MERTIGYRRFPRHWVPRRMEQHDEHRLESASARPRRLVSDRVERSRGRHVSDRGKCAETGHSSNALDPATGKDIWYAPSPKVACSWSASAPCFNAQSAAPFAIPGVVLAGTMDGHERAYAATDGRILWDFDTARGTYQTINGVAGQAGGSIDVSSGSLASGMLYVISGYRGILGGGSNNVLLALSLDGR
jgi:hypothetical protein